MSSFERGDDRATIYGALLSLAELLASDRREEALMLWRRRGQRAFAAEQDEKATLRARDEARP